VVANLSLKHYFLCEKMTTLFCCKIFNQKFNVKSGGDKWSLKRKQNRFWTLHGCMVWCKSIISFFGIYLIIWYILIKVYVLKLSIH
jgi:hypothetical protein